MQGVPRLVGHNTAARRHWSGQGQDTTPKTNQKIMKPKSKASKKAPKHITLSRRRRKSPEGGTSSTRTRLKRPEQPTTQTRQQCVDYTHSTAVELSKLYLLLSLLQRTLCRAMFDRKNRCRWHRTLGLDARRLSERLSNVSEQRKSLQERTNHLEKAPISRKNKNPCLGIKHFV